MIQDLASHTASKLDGQDSLYKQVAFRISELIEHGTLRPGVRVPSVRKCSEQQNVSIATVTQAYRTTLSSVTRRTDENSQRRSALT